jgi:hypothetical protein
VRLLLLLLCGCHAPVTETLVTVSASGLTVGVDINGLHISAIDTVTPGFGFDRAIALCPGPAGCSTLPVSVVLYPGSKSPQDPVRVLVEGLRDDQPVISNVALFSFISGARQRLDFILYGSCLNRLECAGQDMVCGADGMCVPINPTMGLPDLSAGVVVDLGMSDLAAGGDLAMAHDLAGVDFSGCGDPGQPCCANSTCNAINLACYNATCQPCGGSSQWCCPFATNFCGASLGCDDTFHCITCGGDGQPCCSGGMCTNGGICSQGLCQPAGCGKSSQPCCPNGLCDYNIACLNNSCTPVTCNSGSPCCNNTYCGSGSTCYSGTCHFCGSYQSEACATTRPCDVPFQADPFAGLCGLCDFSGYPCCGGAGGVCSGGLVCAGIECM